MLDRIVEALFDYAGMYPPAKLSFEEALDRSLRFDEELTRPHLVGTDFVLSSGLLPKLLESQHLLHGRAALFRVAVIPDTPPSDSKSLIAEMSSLFSQIEGLVENERPPIRLVSCELRSTEPIDALIPSLKELLPPLAEMLGDFTPFLFIECDRLLGSEPSERTALYELLHDVNTLSSNLRVGIKTRCAGASATTRTELATLLVDTYDHSLPLKATAGLHHPLIERERYGNEVGFLTLALARLLLDKFGPDRLIHGDLQACLAAENPRDFNFSEEKCTWREFSLTLADLESANERALLRIGSCSINEPDADLARLFGTPDERELGFLRRKGKSPLVKSSGTRATVSAGQGGRVVTDGRTVAGSADHRNGTAMSAKSSANAAALKSSPSPQEKNKAQEKSGGAARGQAEPEK